MKMARVILVLLLSLSVRGTARQGQYVVDCSGFWNTTPRNQDGSGMTGDAAGLPPSKDAQWRGASWSGEDLDVAE
jgi:hypothetical protein